MSTDTTTAGTVPFTRTLDPTFDVADGVTGLRSIMVNVYFISLANRDGVGRWVLVDAGLPISAHAIRQTAAKLYGEGMPPEAIILTHAHFDHVSSLKTLADEWDVAIFAHPLEFPYLTGRNAYAPPDPWVGGGMAMVSPMYSRGPIDVHERLMPLPEDGSVPFLTDWKWIHTPGHSPGHVSLFRESDRALIAGDAFVNCRQEYISTVLAQSQGVFGPPRYFTHDWAAAEASVKLLAGLEPETAGTGHGTPMHGERLRQQLHDLATNFQDEVPVGGRYSDEPVIYDQNGPEHVPPAKPVPRAVYVTGAALAIGAAVGIAAAVVAHESQRNKA